MQSKQVNTIFEYLGELFGANPICEINYKSDIDLLVAIILSAQCTDKRVNVVTRELFKKYKTVGDYATADPKELQTAIHSCGFYRTKSANIIKMAQSVIRDHNGKIPANIDCLTTLAGVGRKTANVFLGEYYKTPSLAVDTHVTRVSHRLNLSSGKTPEIIERDLMQIFDKKNWNDYHKYLVLFGRYYCKSQRPLCNDCKLCAQCAMIQHVS